MFVSAIITLLGQWQIIVKEHTIQKQKLATDKGQQLCTILTLG